MTKKKAMINKAIDWAKERISEDSTTLGVLLVAAGTVAVFPVIIKIAGLLTIGYGIYYIAKKDK